MMVKYASNLAVVLLINICVLIFIKIEKYPMLQFALNLIAISSNSRQRWEAKKDGERQDERKEEVDLSCWMLLVDWS